MAYQKVPSAMNALGSFCIRFVLVYCMLIACFVNCSEKMNAEKAASDYLSHFHMEASIRNLREGDRYNVSCWADSISSLNTTFCNGLDQLSIHINEQKLKTNILNASGIYHEVESAKPKHLNDFKYTCKCNKTNIKSSKFMIGVKWEITEFGCRFIDNPGDVPLNCSFSIPMKVFNVYQSTSFNLQYEGRLLNCPKPTFNESRMLCTLPNFQTKFKDFYEFKLSVNDSLDLKEWNFTLNRTEVIVLKKPGENVKKLNKSINSICLEWDDYQKDNHIGHNISWSVQLSPKDNNMTWELEHLNLMKETLCLKNLSHPYQNYTVSVSRRYNESRAHWSERFIYNFSTNPTIPSRPPMVWPGSYHFRNSTNLHVYWQQIPLLERNGPQFTYNVIVRNVRNNTTL